MTGKILLIEDEADLREEIADMLAFAGYLVYTASDGIEGLSLAKALDPALIVCDVMMPGLDGYDVLDMLRSGSEPNDVPFLFLTAKSAREDMRRGMNLGADDYLTKPFNMDELLEAVAARLERVELSTTTREDKVEAAKASFMRMVAHELRTPVTSMTVSTELLLDDLQAEPEKLERMARIAHSGGKRLQLLVERMMMYLRYETGDLTDEDMSEFAYPLTVENAIDAALEKAQAFYNEQQQVTQQLEQPKAMIKASRQYIDYALAEVIANALKFSPPGEPVRIRQWVEDGFVHVSVSNTGTAIPYEAIQQAMEPFAQIDRDLLEQQGIGLGLPLANRVVKALGGSLAIMPAPRTGTDCVISLPDIDTRL